MDHLSDEQLGQWLANTNPDGTPKTNNEEGRKKFEAEVNKLNTQITDALHQSEEVEYGKTKVLEAIKGYEEAKQDPAKALEDIARSMENSIKEERRKEDEVRRSEMQAVSDLIKLQSHETKMKQEHMQIEQSLNNITDYFNSFDGTQEQAVDLIRKMGNGDPVPLSGTADLNTLRTAIADGLRTSSGETHAKYLDLQQQASETDPSDTATIASLISECIAHGVSKTNTPIVPMRSVKEAIYKALDDLDNPSDAALKTQYEALLVRAEATDPNDGIACANLMTEIITLQPLPQADASETPQQPPARQTTKPATHTTTQQPAKPDAAEPQREPAAPVAQVSCGKATIDSYVFQTFLQYSSMEDEVELVLCDEEEGIAVEWEGNRVTGLLTVCKVVAGLCSKGRFMYPTKSVILMGLVDEALEDVRPLLGLTRAVVKYEAVPRGWVKGAQAANEDLVSLLNEVRAVMTRINSKYFKSDQGDTMFSVKPVLPDVILTCCVKVLSAYGLRPSTLACHRVAYALSSEEKSSVALCLPPPDTTVLSVVSSWLETSMQSTRRARIAGLA